MAAPDRRIAAAAVLLLAPLLTLPAAPASAQETVPGLRTVRTGGVAVETAALILSGQDGGEIPLEGLAVPLPPAEGEDAGPTRVLVVVEAAGGALMAYHPGGALGISVVVYALGEDGGLSGTLLQSFEIDTSVLGERLAKSGVKFVGDLALPAGSYRLRALVKAEHSGALGLRTLAVEVPEDAAPPPELEVLDEAAEAWIVAREPGARLPAAEARPDLVRRETEDGTRVAAWPTAGRTPAAAPPAREAAPDPKDLQEKALRAHLDAVLTALASGQESEARSRFWELVPPILRASERESLENVESSTFRAVAEQRPAALGPVMMLYDWLYREGLEKRDTAVSTHARTTVLKLVQLFLRSSEGTPAAGSGSTPQRQAAQMLICLGGVVQQAGLVDLSNELFLRALELDRGNEAAILALAAADERVGDPEAALAHLAQLLEVDPEHGQARLRTAVNLVRLGRVRAARRHLEGLVAGRHAPWILSLGYQELAQLHLAANRLEDAAGVLRAGLAKLPGDEKLLLQSAFVHDALAEPDEALGVLARLGRQRAGSETSPRRRYTQWPSEALERTRRALVATAAEQRSDLAAALGLPPSEAHAP